MTELLSITLPTDGLAGCFIDKPIYDFVNHRRSEATERVNPSPVLILEGILVLENEQLRDLLNPASGILHARWNAKNGFFVEDLMVVECTSI